MEPLTLSLNNCNSLVVWFLLLLPEPLYAILVSSTMVCPAVTWISSGCEQVNRGVSEQLANEALPVVKGDCREYKLVNKTQTMK